MAAASLIETRASAHQQEPAILKNNVLESTTNRHNRLE
jgi:hypothetical protein